MEFCELQLEFCHIYVSKPKHMAQSDHDQTNTFIRYLLSHRHIHLQKKKKKIHPSAFVTVGLVL